MTVPPPSPVSPASTESVPVLPQVPQSSSSSQKVLDGKSEEQPQPQRWHFQRPSPEEHERLISQAIRKAEIALARVIKAKDKPRHQRKTCKKNKGLDRAAGDGRTVPPDSTGEFSQDTTGEA